MIGQYAFKHLCKILNEDQGTQQILDNINNLTLRDLLSKALHEDP